MPRGRGFSTGKAIQILFRLIADGSQARAEAKKTAGATKQEIRAIASETSREIRSVETLGQRVLTILSRPIRGRLGLFGALGVSTLRESLRGLADKEITKVHDKLGVTADAADKLSKRTGTLTTNLTATGVAMRNVSALSHAKELDAVARRYAETAAAVAIFQKVLDRAPGKTVKGAFGDTPANGEELRSLLRGLNVANSRGVGAAGGTFKTVKPDVALAEFTAGFNAIEDSELRAALAVRVFGADAGKMLPILERMRSSNQSVSESLAAYEKAAAHLTEVERRRQEIAAATTELEGLHAQLTKTQTEAINASAAASKAEGEAIKHANIGRSEKQNIAKNDEAVSRTAEALAGQQIRTSIAEAAAREAALTATKAHTQVMLENRAETGLAKKAMDAETAAIRARKFAEEGLLEVAKKRGEAGFGKVGVSQTNLIPIGADPEKQAEARAVATRLEARAAQELENAQVQLLVVEEAREAHAKAAAEAQRLQNIFDAEHLALQKQIGVTSAQTRSAESLNLVPKAKAKLAEDQLNEAVRKQAESELLRSKILGAGEILAQKKIELSKLEAAGVAGVAREENLFLSIAKNMGAARRAEADAAGVAAANLKKYGGMMSGMAAAQKTAAPAAAGFLSTIGLIGAGVLAAIAALLVMTGVLFLIAKASAHADAPIGRLADRLKISAELLSGLDAAAQKADVGGIKNISERLGSFERILGQVKAGALPDVRKLLAGLGVDANTASKDVTGALTTIINKFNETKDPTQRAVILQKLFADRTGKLGATFRAIGPDVDKWLAQLKENGRLLTTDQAEAAKRFEESLEAIKRQAAAVGQQFARQLVPEISKALKALTAEGKAFGSTAEFVGRQIATIVKGYMKFIVNSAALLRAINAERRGEIPNDQSFVEKFREEKKFLYDFLQSTDKSMEEQEADEAERQETSVKEFKKASEARVAALEAGGAEARRIEEELTAMYKRQVSLRTMSRVQEVAKEIDAKRELARTDLTIARAKTKEEEDRPLDERRGETEANRVANLAVLREREKQIESDFNKFEADSRASLAVELRDQQDKAHDDAIAALQEEANKAINIERRKAEDRVDLAVEATLKINAIERGMTEIRRAELFRRLILAKEDTDLQRELASQLKAFNAKSDDEELQRTKNLEDAKLAVAQEELRREEAVMQKRALANQFWASKIQRQEKQGAITHEQAARSLARLEESELEDRITLLKQQIVALEQHNKSAAALKDQLVLLQQEKKNKVLASEFAITDGLMDDLDRREGVYQRILEVEFRNAETLLGIRQKDLDDFRASRQFRHASEKGIIEEQVQINLDQENLQHDHNLTEIEAESQRIVDEGILDQAALDQLQANNRAIEEENRRHDSALAEIANQGERDKLERRRREQGFQTGLESGQLAELAAGVQSFADVSKVAFSAVGAVVNGLAQGVGQLVQNWVLMGTTGPAAMRKLVASVLAGVSAQAAVMAVMSLAYGFASLTPWGAALFGPAPPWFQAAALFGSIAVITGLLGRSIAGDAFQQNGGGSATNAAAGPQDSGPQRLNEGRREVVEHIHRTVHEIRPPRGWVVNELHEEVVVNNSPKARNAINKAVE